METPPRLREAVGGVFLVFGGGDNYSELSFFIVWFPVLFFTENLLSLGFFLIRTDRSVSIRKPLDSPVDEHKG
jgi:hypothetical protein